MARAQPSLPVAARKALLDWYRPRARAYPWRRGRPNAYRTLVSELMLQQTQAPRVVPIFEAFVGVFPTVRALAGASRADVLRAWAGLGYNRRAVSLHRAAQAVVAEHRRPRPDGPCRPAASARRRPLHRGGGRVDRRWRARRSDRRERRVGSSARVAYGRRRRERVHRRHRRDRGDVGRSHRPRRLEPGVDGSRAGALPGGPALRRVSARARLPIRTGWPRAGAGRLGGSGPVRGIDASGPRRCGRRATRTTVGRCRRSRAEHRVRSRSDRGGARRAGARRRRSALRALVSAPRLTTRRPIAT